jgi:hypothetical protein
MLDLSGVLNYWLSFYFIFVHVRRRAKVVFLYWTEKNLEWKDKDLSNDSQLFKYFEMMDDDTIMLNNNFYCNR